MGGIALEPLDIISQVLRVIGGLFICFYAVGESLTSALRIRFSSIGKLSSGVIAFNLLLSFSYFMCVSIILSLQYSLNNINLALAMIPFIFISDFVGFKLENSANLEPGRIEGNRRNLQPIMVILIFGISLAFLFRSGFRWPSMSGWDQYIFLGGSNWIFTYHGIKNILPVGSNSVFPYPYLFQILVASTAILVDVAPYSLFWFAPFIMIPVYGLLVYGVSYRITQERAQSFAAALIALSVSGGESLLGPHYFFPSTISLFLFLLLLVVILEPHGKERAPVMFIYGFVLMYSAFYYYPLILTFPILLLFHRKNRDQSSRPIFVFSLIGMTLVSVLGGIILSFGQTLSLAEKLETIRRIYPVSLWLLFFGGATIVVVKYFIGLSKEKNLLAVLIYTTSLLLVYFLPPSVSNRAEIIFRSFFAIIASVSLLWIQHSFESVTRKVLSVREHKVHLKELPSVFSHTILVLIILLLIQPYIFYASNVPHWSNISMDEYLAAEWIRQNSLPDGYILTDPSTGYVLRGLTLRNSSVTFIIEGHTPSHASGLGANLSKLIYDFFREEDPLKVPDYLEKFPNLPELIVISTRTSSWVKSGTINKMIFTPTTEKLRPFRGIDKFSTPLFILSKSWESVKIYRLTEANHESE